MTQNPLNEPLDVPPRRASGAGSHAAEPEHTDLYAEDPRSFGEIANDLLSNASTLVRQEVELAKAEATQAAGRAGKGAGMFGGAGVAGFLALLFASIAAWWALGLWLDTMIAPGFVWSALIIAVVYGIVALVLANSGKSEFQRIKGLPKTADTVSKLPNALTGNEEKN